MNPLYQLVMAVSAFIYYIFGGIIFLNVFELEIEPIPFFIGMVLFVIICLVITRGIVTRCPRCGKWFAMKEVERNFEGRTDTTVEETKYIRNSKGEKIGSYTANVPATESHYNCLDRCKHCAFERKAYRSETYKKY